MGSYRVPVNNSSHAPRSANTVPDAGEVFLDQFFRSGRVKMCRLPIKHEPKVPGSDLLFHNIKIAEFLS